jgi:hypothetical protein
MTKSSMIGSPAEVFGMKIFKGVDLPPPAPEKNVFCIIVNNLPDGIGDFQHAMDFATHIKSYLSERGYKLAILVESNTDLDRSKDDAINWRANYVKQQLEVEKALFDGGVYLFQPDMAKDTGFQFNEWRESNKSSLEVLSKSTAGAMMVSYNTHRVHTIFPEALKIVFCLQYGMQPWRSPTLHQANMGKLDPNSPACYGIKIKDYSKDGLTRQEKMETLKENEPDLVKALLREQSVVNYFDTHYLMPAYLQTRSAACAFVLIQALRFKNEKDKTIDLHLPSKVVDRETLVEILEKNGISRDEIDFITPDDKKNIVNEKARIRIISWPIKLDADYDLLHAISDGAGASGDNSITNACSLDAIPWFEIKGYGEHGGLGRFMGVEFPDFITKLAFDATENAQSLHVLAEYFTMLSRFRHLSMTRISRSDIFDPIFSDYDNDKPSEQDAIRGPKFQKYCECIAEYLRGDYGELNSSWKYVAQKLRENNYYDQLENIVKASVYTSASPDPTLIHCILNCLEVIHINPRRLCDILREKEGLFRYIALPDVLSQSEALQACFEDTLLTMTYLLSDEQVGKVRNALEKCDEFRERPAQLDEHRKTLLAYHYLDRTPQPRESFTPSAKKPTGVSIGQVVKRKSDQAEFMEKESYDPVEGATTKTHSFFCEYISGILFKRVLYDRVPLINIQTSDNAKGVLTSKYLESFTPLSEVLRGRDKGDIIPAEGIEKILVAGILLGEIDFNAGNLGVMKSLNDQGQPTTIFAKVDHGYALTSFSSTPQKALEDSILNMIAYINNGWIQIDLHSLKVAAMQMSFLSDEEIENLIENRIAILKKSKNDVTDVSFPIYIDGVFERRVFENLDALGKFYINSVKMNLNAVRELVDLLTIIEHLSPMDQRFFEGQWINDRELWSDPVEWAIKNGKTIAGEDPEHFLGQPIAQVALAILQKREPPSKPSLGG